MGYDEDQFVPKQSTNFFGHVKKQLAEHSRVGIYIERERVFLEANLSTCN